jgi:hypothetical protein
MIIKCSVNNRIGCEFSILELTILYNSIFETIKEIEDWEFQTRIGANTSESRLLLDKFYKLNNSLTKQENKNIKINISKDEMLIIINSLNEVLYGFHIDDFENRIGATASDVRLLLTEFAQCFDETAGMNGSELKTIFDIGRKL